jgi:hypothetical protein
VIAHVAVLTQSSLLTSMILSVEIPCTKLLVHYYWSYITMWRDLAEIAAAAGNQTLRMTSDWSGRLTMMSMATGRTSSNSSKKFGNDQLK